MQDNTDMTPDLPGVHRILMETGIQQHINNSKSEKLLKRKSRMLWQYITGGGAGGMHNRGSLEECIGPGTELLSTKNKHLEYQIKKQYAFLLTQGLNSHFHNRQKVFMAFCLYLFYFDFR